MYVPWLNLFNKSVFVISIKYIFNLAYQSQVVAYHFDFYIDSKITPNILNNNCNSFDVSWFLNYNAIFLQLKHYLQNDTPLSPSLVLHLKRKHMLTN